MPVKILLPHSPASTTYAGQVPTDDLPRSAFAIVFSNLRVRPRPAKGEVDSPKVK